MPHTPEIITYEQVKMAMLNPPPKCLIDLFNEISLYINNHPLCISEQQPFNRLCQPNSFCVSATSIQSEYIAFVLGKHIDSSFPEDVIRKFFNVDLSFKIQFGTIKGKQIDGCICMLHPSDKIYDLTEVYAHIYS